MRTKEEVEQMLINLRETGMSDTLSSLVKGPSLATLEWVLELRDKIMFEVEIV